ncbi:MAG: DUF2520 domain-containing protein [Bacteroidetes bacterium]|nr:DUF2520 domain-containing protein [Bacteroidota bacterium]
MKIVIIGSGNVATVLSRLLLKNNHQVLQVMSRNIDHARALADELNVNYSDLSGQPDESADVIILAVSDFVVLEGLPQLHFNNKLILHTAGSVSKEVLKELSANYGVLYPLQSLVKDAPVTPEEIPLLIDGNSEGVIQYIEDLARSISPIVRRVGDDDRLKLHAAAVIVSNFTNHLYAIAEDFCSKEHIEFDMLKPLIMETANRIQHTSPSKLQTGPAVRKDIQTLDKHLRVLTNHPKLRTTYLRLTDSIMNP